MGGNYLFLWKAIGGPPQKHFEKLEAINNISNIWPRKQ